MNLKYFIGGVSGVGKTTLLNTISSAMPNFRVINGSGELMKWLDIPGDYDALRALPQEHKIVEWGKCLEELLREADSDILVDGHYLNLINGVVTSIADDWIWRFDGLVLVTAPTVDILRRIDNDPSRDRALFKFDEDNRYGAIEAYQQQTLDEFRRLAGQVGSSEPIPSLIIHHQQQKTLLAAREFEAFDYQLRRTIALVK